MVRRALTSGRSAQHRDRLACECGKLACPGVRIGAAVEIQLALRSIFEESPAARTEEQMSEFSIPVITTERLTLRPFRDIDLEDYATFCADPEVMRWVGSPLDRAESWRQMATFLGQGALRGYGPWAAELRESGAFVGRIGLWHPEGWPGTEVGWLLGRAFWGHGYATEGGRAALDFARDNLGLQSAVSVIHPENSRSIAVAERLDGEHDYETVVMGQTVGVWTFDQL